MEQKTPLQRIGRVFARMSVYLLIGAATGLLLGIVSGAYLGISIQNGAGRLGAITGSMTKIAFYIWIMGEIVIAFNGKWFWK